MLANFGGIKCFTVTEKNSFCLHTDGTLQVQRGLQSALVTAKCSSENRLTQDYRI
jgi:hypothetical protein